MARRTFIKALSALPVGMIAGSTFAQSNPTGRNNAQSSTPALPYSEITPTVIGETKKVHAIIAFTCPVCAKYHNMLTGWGNSLPRAFSFDLIPVVDSKDSMITTAVWLAMKKVAPERLPALGAALFRVVQERGLSPTTSQTQFWNAVFKETGVAPGFDKELKAVRQEDLKRLANLVQNYQITATPSIAICGRYVITPDNTNGDERLFISLANGLVSKFV